MVKLYIPQRGDIIKLSFSPQVGKEQAGYHPTLVISPQAYNRISHFVLACPILYRLLLIDVESLNRHENFYCHRGSVGRLAGRNVD